MKKITLLILFLIGFNFLKAQCDNIFIEPPILSNMTIAISEGQFAILYAMNYNTDGTGNIIWQDINGNVVGEGNTYQTEAIYSNTIFYAMCELTVDGISCFSNTSEIEVSLMGVGLEEFNVTKNGKIFDILGKEWPNYKTLPNGLFVQNGKKYIKI
tara:strand:+ start:108 stop:575 length:468 start_codon:yes stop_codon:yes gene_type:complete